MSFYIKDPNGKNIELHYRSKDFTVEDRMDKLQMRLLKHWEMYCRNNWSTIAFGRLIFSRDVQQFLDRCATFIDLNGHKISKTLSEKRLRAIRQREIPASSASAQVENLFYGEMGGEVGEEGEQSFVGMSTSSEFDKIEMDIDETQMSVQELHNREKRLKKIRDRYRDSKGFRMEKLYCTDEIQTYRVRQVFSYDVTQYKIGESPEDAVIETMSDRNKDGKKCAAKTILGTPIFIDKPYTIGGNKGIIDKSKPYISAWCTVDTDNEFTFNGKSFVIDKKVSQYQPDRKGYYAMDKILCYFIPHENQYHFFNQDVEQIDDKFVRENK